MKRLVIIQLGDRATRNSTGCVNGTDQLCMDETLGSSSVRHIIQALSEVCLASLLFAGTKKDLLLEQPHTRQHQAGQCLQPGVHKTLYVPRILASQAG